MHQLRHPPQKVHPAGRRPCRVYSPNHSPALHGRMRSHTRNIPPMPIELTDAELATAAFACRAMAAQEGRRAKELGNPTVRGPIESAAQRYERLAEKLEAARRGLR